VGVDHKVTTEEVTVKTPGKKGKLKEWGGIGAKKGEKKRDAESIRGEKSPPIPGKVVGISKENS